MNPSPTMSLTDMMLSGQYDDDQVGSDAYAPDQAQPGTPSPGAAPPSAPSDDDLMEAVGPEHGAAILNARDDVEQAKSDVQDKHLALVGKSAEAIQASGYDHEVANAVFAHLAGQPEFAESVGQLQAAVQQDPSQLKPMVDEVAQAAAGAGSGSGDQGQADSGPAQGPDDSSDDQDASGDTDDQDGQGPSAEASGSGPVVGMTELQRAAMSEASPFANRVGSASGPSSNSSPDTENDEEGGQSSPQRSQQSQQPQRQKQQNQNRAATPALKGPYVVNLKDPAIASLLDPNHKPSKKDVIGPNGECVDLTKKFSGMGKEDVGTYRWRPGSKVLGNQDIQPGTAIATFDETGRYPNEHKWNSAIYLGPGVNGSIWVLDQWKGHSPRPREIHLDRSNKGAPADNSAAYSVIQVVPRK